MKKQIQLLENKKPMPRPIETISSADDIIRDFRKSLLRQVAKSLDAMILQDESKDENHIAPAPENE